MFREYYERGLSVIPVLKKGKSPIIRDWSRFCKVRPSEEEVDKWDKGNFNIGVTCGPASGIIVIDIDTDDPEIMKKCPMSPVVRRGAKGEARFFKYNKSIKSQSIPLIDILSDGRQVVLPPSIHPLTNEPYKWISQDTLENFDISDLPELDNLDFLGGIKVEVSTEGGRNNKLVDIVTSMRARGEAEENIINEIYEWDKTYHDPRLFNDSSEGNKAKNEEDARTNAWRFVTSVTMSLINNGAVASEDTTIVIEDETKITPLYKNKDFPRPTGLMGDIMELIEDIAERDMPNLALGGAISIMAILCSNRFRFNQTWTNVYVLNLAPTGAGKSFPQRIIKELLCDTNLMGFGSYKSSSSISKNLTSRRERLDIIDEISGLFGHMKSGGAYQVEMVDELCKLWSDSNSLYLAGEYAGKENTGTCYNPCVSILGSSTIQGIKNNINELMILKGLIPRFLIFGHDNYGKIKIPKELCSKKLKKVKSKIEVILESTKPVSKEKVGLLEGPKYNPKNVAPTDKEAKEFYEQIRMQFALDIEKSSNTEPHRAMITRGKEQVMKLATLHAVSNARRVTVDDLSWAKRVVDVSFHNAKHFIEESSVSGEWERDLVSILNYIEKKGFVTKPSIMNYFRRIPSIRIKQILTQLIESDKIESIVKVHGRNKTKMKGFRTSDAGLIG